MPMGRLRSKMKKTGTFSVQNEITNLSSHQLHLLALSIILEMSTCKTKQFVWQYLSIPEVVSKQVYIACLAMCLKCTGLGVKCINRVYVQMIESSQRV